MPCSCANPHAKTSGIVSEHSLRLAYSMALVRFVNGVVDSGQKGQVASSVATLARTYGLPRMLVNASPDCVQ